MFMLASVFYCLPVCGCFCMYLCVFVYARVVLFTGCLTVHVFVVGLVCVCVEKLLEQSGTIVK